jgi:glycosyltransferase involved in cell wall biosynthesis
MAAPLPHVCFVAINAYPLLAGDQEIPVVGGAELQQIIIAKELVKRGHPVSMVCLDFGQPDNVVIDGIRVLKAYRPDEGVPILRFFWPRLASLWNCMKRTEADVYYQRAAGMQTGVVAAFCKRHGKKSVFAVAGDPMIRLQRDRLIYEYGARHVDRIVVQTGVQAAQFRAEFGRESVLIPNCYLYTGAVVATGARLSREVLWVSTIRDLKQPEVFLDLATAFPHLQFRMIGGPGDDESALYDLIRARAAALPNVMFSGFLPYSQVEDVFDDAAVFVNTSRTEGFPNTFLQAWARGIPTVSFFDSGARENGQAVGRIVQSLDEMKGIVGGYMSDERMRTMEGKICRRYFEANHTPNRVLDAYQQLFRNLLAVDSVCS